MLSVLNKTKNPTTITTQKNTKKFCDEMMNAQDLGCGDGITGVYTCPDSSRYIH